MARRPRWYDAGVRFECRPDCGACCVNHDDYAYVYLTDDDVTLLADHLELPRERFLTQYTDVEEGRTFLKIDSPECTFLDGARCGVYAARPLQCRTFPFWPENLRTRKRWQSLGRFCPGIDEGPVHDRPTVERTLEEFKRWDD